MKIRESKKAIKIFQYLIEIHAKNQLDDNRFLISISAAIQSMIRKTNSESNKKKEANFYDIFYFFVQIKV